MIDFFNQNREAISFILSFLGILITFLFRVLLNWRHKICFEYASKRDVSISIVQEKFVREVTKHYETVSFEKEKQDTSIDEIYKRPEQRGLINSFSKFGENISKIKRWFRKLDFCSSLSLFVVLGLVILFLLLIIYLWIHLLTTLITIIWAILFSIFCLLLVFLTGYMLFLDSKFFKLVNDIIEPET